MIPPSWRICDRCPARHDVERVDGRYLCFDCRLTQNLNATTPKDPYPMKALLLVLLTLVVSCTVAPFEHRSSSELAPSADSAPGQECVLWHEKQHAPAGDCFVVTADTWSTLATCDGTHAENETGKTWEPACSGCGRSYPTSSFEIPGGGCFQYYICDPAGVELPSVEPCQ